MNGDLRLGFASNDFAGTKWKNLTGTGAEMVAPRLLAPHQRAVMCRASRMSSTPSAPGHERSIRWLAD